MTGNLSDSIDDLTIGILKVSIRNIHRYSKYGIGISFVAFTTYTPSVTQFLYFFIYQMETNTLLGRAASSLGLHWWLRW